MKISAFVDSGHDLKYYSGLFTDGGLVTYGFDGTLILRRPEGTPEYGGFKYKVSLIVGIPTD